MEEIKKQLIIRKQQREARQAELQKKALDKKLQKVKNNESKEITSVKKSTSKASLHTKPAKSLGSQSSLKSESFKVKSNTKATANGPAVVRQTLTSNLRIVKSNYLFLPGVAKEHEKRKCQDKTLKPLCSSSSNTDFSSKSNTKLDKKKDNETSSARNVFSNVNAHNDDAGAPRKQWTLPKPASEFKFKLPKEKTAKPETICKKEWVLPQVASKFKFALPNEKDNTKKTLLKVEKEKLNTIHTIKEKEKANQHKNKTQEKVMRRSISSLYRCNIKNVDVNSCIKRSMSVSLAKEIINSDMHTISEEEDVKSLNTSALKTPVSGPTRNELQVRLEKWLKSRGKSVHSYQHLKCFGICSPYNQKQSNKENNPIRKKLFDFNSSENAVSRVEPSYKYHQSTPIPAVLENKKDSSVEYKVAEAVLHDLYRLILDGYPKDQCESWLHLVKQHYGILTEFAIYWECKAALQGEDGDFYNAVSSYQVAIIKGAEPTSIQKHLDSLLEKFSDLNISTSKFSYESDNSRSVLDKKNIFTSTVIKFAVQQKQAKDFDPLSDLQYIATPVRRSMRINNKTSGTPALGSASKSNNKTLKPVCYNSMNNISVDVRKSLVFKTNSALDSPQ